MLLRQLIQSCELSGDFPNLIEKSPADQLKSVCDVDISKYDWQREQLENDIDLIAPRRSVTQKINGIEERQIVS